MDNSLNNIDESNLEDNLNINTFLKILSKKKKYLISFSLISFLIGCVIGLTTKKVWEGKLQIVLSEERGNSDLDKLQINESFSDLFKTTTRNSLKTEVEILKSPSVLMPVFDFISNQKSLKDQNHKKNKYSKWLKKNLSVKLSEGTSVLNLAYKDTDKDLIIPALQKISEAYQKYSGKDRNRDLELSINFLKEQLSKYKIKTRKSIIDAEKYAMQENLEILDGPSYEKIRLKTRNNINLINEKISQLNSVDNEYVLGYMSKTITPEFEDNSVLNKIKEIDSQLKYKSGIFKENDEIIIRLKKRKSDLISLQKQYLLGQLNSIKLSEEARLNAAKRPPEVILKFNELQRKVAINQNTLQRLENQKNLLDIENAKRNDPWELISKPTLLTNPVAPLKKQIAIRFLFFGFVFGSIYSYVSYKREGNLYFLEEIKSILNNPPILTLNRKLLKESRESLILLFENINNSKKVKSDKINFVKTGSINENDLSSYINNLLGSENNNKFIIYNNLIEAKNAEKQILIFSSGQISNIQINKLVEDIKIKNENIIGWIFIDDQILKY